MAKMKEDGRPMGSPRSWAATYGTHLAGQAAIDGADHAAIEAEARWGAGRLRLLVSTELREKFDRQRYLFNKAVWTGDLASVQEQSRRMVKAWQALDAAAVAAGASVLSPVVWETVLLDGTVVALVRTSEEARAVVAEGRQMVVYTLAEIGVMLSHYREAVAPVKELWPGAVVEAVRPISDPLDAFHTSTANLDDPLPSDLGGVPLQ